MKRKIMVVATIILVAVMMCGVIYCSRSNELWSGFGTVTEKEQKGDEYFTTVTFNGLEKTFEGKAIYDSFEEQDEVEVLLLKKKIFGFTYKTEMGVTGSKK